MGSQESLLGGQDGAKRLQMEASGTPKMAATPPEGSDRKTQGPREGVGHRRRGRIAETQGPREGVGGG